MHAFARLPVYDSRDALVTACLRDRCVILVAPTGSGKSTQVPAMLLDSGIAGNGRIVVLQPRRIAARLLARRVARERNGFLGDEVGYRVRFENRTTPRTRIVYETDGILVRTLLRDPLLKGTSMIVFDEFHERHLYSDLMLGFARRLQAGPRPDLCIIVMSATLDSASLQTFLAPCQTISSSGRTFPVSIRHVAPGTARPDTPPWQHAASETGRLLEEQKEGHILVFMPGAYEIRKTITALQGIKAARGCHILPLHGELPPSEQDKAVDPSHERKIIVTTNVAETSLTIEGVTAVVDSGLARQARFDPHRGIDTLLIEKISAASAEQRAGRAGRTSPGVAIRLWSRDEHKHRPDREDPEMCRIDLTETVLQMAALGIADIRNFPWITAPAEERLQYAICLLSDLGALDERGAITSLGRRLAAFPVHPRVARIMVAAAHYDCVSTACLVAAILQDRAILTRTRERSVHEKRLDLIAGRDDSDLLLMVHAFAFAKSRNFSRDATEPLGIHVSAARSAEVSWQQLCRIAEEQKLSVRKNPFPFEPDDLHRCLLAGFPDRVALRLGEGTSRSCTVVHGRRGTLADATVLGRHSLLIAADINELGTSSGTVTVRLESLAAIRQEWLEDTYPEAFSLDRHVFFNAAAKRVEGEQQQRFHDLIVHTAPLSDISDDEAATLLAAEVLSGRLSLKQWDVKVEQWLARIDLVARLCPEFNISALTDTDRLAVLSQICYGFRSYREIKNLPVMPVLRAWLSPEQSAAVEAYAPERITLSNGRTPKVSYEDRGGPYFSLRIQELYDVTLIPAICMGRITPLVHILAPNHRPVQITADLAGFWATGYERAKKELRGRYPKHEWR